MRTRCAALAAPATHTTQATAESALIAKRAVWTALDALPPRRRAIVVMCEIDGMSPDDIAPLLGIAVITVRWHLSMARRELKRALLEYLGDADEDADRHPSRRRSAAR